MKTAVIMKRELFGMPISQNSKNEFFSLTELVRAGNKWRMMNDMPRFEDKAWLKNKGTLEFIAELEQKFGVVRIAGCGRGHHTWVHPLLFIDCALAISPALKVETYQWLFDQLIQKRNDSGDSYNLMCGTIYNRWQNKKTYTQYVQKVALDIKSALGVKDWQTATEEQLKARDELHKEITLLCDVLNDARVAVRIALDRVTGSDSKIDIECKLRKK